ncbi:hypothetical protein GWK47_027746 [Chionoecetes opilio]|uniref:Uncharacterized protein n=1 Tax=Chionoecetes opilio TaxID=41210 RepID=A0A8J8WC31_CHIOP|nr:hypothetical protein GWK47_027746 [Chionoecetes opilio]
MRKCGKWLCPRRPLGGGPPGPLTNPQGGPYVYLPSGRPGNIRGPPGAPPSLSKEVQSGHQPASEEGIPSGYGRVAWRRGDGESPASLVTLPGATGCGYVMCQRGGGAARSTPNITSLGVWRTMRAALPSRPLSSPPPAGWAAGAGPGLRGAVAGPDRR